MPLGKKITITKKMLADWFTRNNRSEREDGLWEFLKNYKSAIEADIGVQGSVVWVGTWHDQPAFVVSRAGGDAVIAVFQNGKWIRLRTVNAVSALSMIGAVR